MHTAIAQNGELIPKVKLSDLDLGKKVGLLGSVEDVSQGVEERFLLVSVLSELSNRLRNEHVEPVQRFGLVRIHVVKRLREDCSRR